MPHWLPDAFIAAVLLLAAFVVAYRVEGRRPRVARALEGPLPRRPHPDRRRGPLRRSARLAGGIELAAGFARRDRRLRSPYALMNGVRIPLGIALVIGGIVADSIVFIVFGAVFLIAGLWTARYSRNIARAERETIARDRSPRSPEWTMMLAC
ncbi:MAG TPA: hypothetical protein VMF55_01005 [Solirubrobacterales bacterium]|nr:hypothetical protein [Solirubrobacterales bacterium]